MDNTKTIWSTAKENTLMEMEMCTKANGRMAKDMEKEYTPSKKVVDSKLYYVFVMFFFQYTRYSSLRFVTIYTVGVFGQNRP